MILNTIACSSLFKKRDPEAALLHLKIGSSHLVNGNYPQALSELLTAHELDPENPEINNNLALAYFVRERFDLAENYLRRALSLNPKYSDARNNLGRVLIERMRYQEAIYELNKVIQDLTYMFPEKPLTNKGIALFKQKKYKESQEPLLKALSLKRDNCLAQSYFGRSLFEMKLYERASIALDNAIGFCQDEHFDEPHYYSALAYYQTGDVDKSVARFEEILRLYPDGKYRSSAQKMLKTIRR